MWKPRTKDADLFHSSSSAKDELHLENLNFRNSPPTLYLLKFLLFDFSSLFSFVFCRLEILKHPSIPYRLKFLIFGFPLSFFPSLFAGRRVPKTLLLYIPPQISDFGFNVSLSFGFWPAAGWRSQTPLLFYTASNFWFLASSLSLFPLAFGRLPAGVPKCPPLYTASNFWFLVSTLFLSSSFCRLPAGGPKVPSYSQILMFGFPLFLSLSFCRLVPKYPFLSLSFGFWPAVHRHSTDHPVWTVTHSFRMENTVEAPSMRQWICGVKLELELGLPNSSPFWTCGSSCRKD